MCSDRSVGRSFVARSNYVEMPIDSILFADFHCFLCNRTRAPPTVGSPQVSAVSLSPPRRASLHELTVLVRLGAAGRGDGKPEEEEGREK